MVIQKSLPLVRISHRNPDFGDEFPSVLRFSIHPGSVHKHIWILQSSSTKRDFLERVFVPIVGFTVEIDSSGFLCNDAVFGSEISRILPPSEIALCDYDRIIDEIVAKASGLLKSGCKGLVTVEIDVTTLHTFQERDLLELDVRRWVEERRVIRSHGMIPASWKAIGALEIKRLDVDDSSKTCYICLDEIPGGSNATRMPCLHLFHENCIIPWLKRSHCCPTCRFELLT